MKKILLLFLFVFLPFSAVLAQIDTLEKLKNKSEEINTVLMEYFGECHSKNYFHQDMGIVEVVYYKDSLLRDNYRLTAMIDDRYLDNPPNKYYTMMDMLFLFYDADMSGKVIYPLLSPLVVEELKKCVGGRVYIRPPQIERWVEFIGTDGKIKRRKVFFISGGNPWNTTLYTFLPEGGYKKLKYL
jgi:hypothetical protein